MEEDGGGGGGGGERTRRNGPNIDLAFFLSLDRGYRYIRVRTREVLLSLDASRSSLFVIQAVAVPSAVEYQTTWITRSAAAALRWER